MVVWVHGCAAVAATAGVGVSPSVGQSVCVFYNHNLWGGGENLVEEAKKQKMEWKEQRPGQIVAFLCDHFHCDCDCVRVH